MKKNYLLWVAFVVTNFTFGQTVFINEIHYDNVGGDINEGIEIAGPAGTNLTGYEIRLYNGSTGETLSPIIRLTKVIPNQSDNMGTLWFPASPIQNGNPDGMALVDNLGVVIQFLSFGGIFSATNGVAKGMTSTNINVIEGESTPIGYSLQLIGTGKTYSDFAWEGPILATPGLPNANQTLPIIKNTIENFKMFPNPVANGKFSITSNSRANKQVDIYSLLGKQVYSKTVKANQPIEVSNLNRGIYILRVEEEGKIATRKLVIE